MRFLFIHGFGSHLFSHNADLSDLHDNPVSFFTNPYGYLSTLEDYFNKKGLKLSLFIYDYRYSLEYFHKELASTLKALSNPKDEIIVLTYGLGGLLFLSFLNTDKYIHGSIRKWISIGCPFQGTNDYLKAALFGPNPGSSFFKFDERLLSKFSV